MVLVADGVIVNASAMAACCAEVRTSTAPPACVATTDLVASVAVGRSVRSRSANAIEPASVSAEPSVMTPATSVAVSTGASFVPVMFTVTS